MTMRELAQRLGFLAVKYDDYGMRDLADWALDAKRQVAKLPPEQLVTNKIAPILELAWVIANT